METQVSAPVGVGSQPIRLGLRAVAWAILSLVGFIAAFVATLLLGVQTEYAFGLSHDVGLGLGALGWVPAGGLLAILAARMAFGAWPQVRTLAWLLLLMGALVSAAHIGVLADWAISRYGYSDPDFIGPTFGLYGVVAAAAVAAFGIQIAPRWAVWMPLLVMLGAVALTVSIVASNIPGLADGVGRDSGPLAAATVAAAVYIGAVGAVSVARLRRG